MKSDAEFFFDEYLRCCEHYRKTPKESLRQREFLTLLSASMLDAYLASQEREVKP